MDMCVVCQISRHMSYVCTCRSVYQSWHPISGCLILIKDPTVMFPFSCSYDLVDHETRIMGRLFLYIYSSLYIHIGVELLGVTWSCVMKTALYIKLQIVELQL